MKDKKIEIPDEYKGVSIEQLRKRANKPFKVENVHVPTEEEKLYWQKIQKMNEEASKMTLESLINSRPKSLIPVKKPYPVEFNVAWNFFMHIYNQVLQKHNKVYKNTAEREYKLQELVKYFIGQESKLDSTKGILLFGGVGTHKTTIMQCLMEMCKAIEQKLSYSGEPFSSYKFNIIPTKTIVTEFTENKKIEVLNKYHKDVWCIDDIGAEDTHKLYGNEYNTIADIIITRYQKYQAIGLLTHGTTNIIDNQWPEKYGTRVASRMKDMFNCIAILGEDSRK